MLTASKKMKGLAVLVNSSAWHRL